VFFGKSVISLQRQVGSEWELSQSVARMYGYPMIIGLYHEVTYPSNATKVE